MICFTFCIPPQLHHLAKLNIKLAGSVSRDYPFEGLLLNAPVRNHYCLLFQSETQQQVIKCIEKVATLLLDNKCDPSLKDTEGMTAFMYAVQQVGETCLKALSSFCHFEAEFSFSCFLL